MSLLLKMSVFLSLTFYQMGCGQDDMSSSGTPISGIRLADPSELQSNAVLNGSYLAEFEFDLPKRKLENLNSFDREFSRVFPSLEGFLQGVPELKSFQYLSAFLNSKAEGWVFPLRLSSQPGFSLPFGRKSSVRVIARVDFKKDESAASLLRKWQKKGRLIYAEPNYKSSLSGWADREKQYASLVEDGGSAYKWLKAIRLPEAFAHLKTLSAEPSQNPIIAVMDSGVDTQHPALKNQIWQNDKGLGQSGCGANDQNGCNTTSLSRGRLGDGDVHPYGTKGMGETCPSTSFGSCPKNCCHGTHVAGIIAGDPEAGVSGACPECRIMVLKVVGPADGSPDGTILDSSIVAALKYLTNFRDENSAAVRIVNASFGKFQRSHSVSALIRALVDTPQKGRGTLIIGAAGNEDSSKMEYPAAYSSAIAVSNIGLSGAKHTSSNFGRWVDISAPGERIVSSVPGGLTEPKTGTSMAAPVVAGIAGLILSARPNSTVESLRNDLLAGSKSKVLYENEVNSAYMMQVADDLQPTPLLGQGYLDAYNAVSETRESTIQSDRLDRVSKSCASLAYPETSSGSFSLFLLFLIPFFVFLVSQFFYSKKD